MSRWFWLGVVLFILPCAGCGPLLDATVSGHVTVEGRALTNGTVVFHPIDPKRAAEASGDIDGEGNFQLRTQDFEGALNGDYKVTVVGDNGERSEAGELTKKPSVITPLHYGLVRQTPLRYHIKPGNNTINLNLEIADRTSKLLGTKESGE